MRCLRLGKNKQVNKLKKKQSAYKYDKGVPIEMKNKSKRIQLKDYTYTLIVIFFISLIAFSFYFISDWSHVQTLSVSGNNEIPDQEILEETAVHPGESLYEVFFIKNRIENDLETRLPQVEAVQLEWEGVNNVNIHIDELQTMAYIQDKGQYLQLLEDGNIVNDPLNITQGSHLVLIKFEEDGLKNIIEELKKIDPPIRESISEVVYTPSDINDKKITIYMNDGNQVIGLYSNISRRLNYYPTMMESVKGESGVFNLETGAYFRPFSSEYNFQENPDMESQESEESLENQELKEDSFDLEAAEELEINPDSDSSGVSIEPNP